MAASASSVENAYTQGNKDIWDKWNQMTSQYSANSQSISAKSNQFWDTVTGDKKEMDDKYSRLEDFNYSNPFETETGKSILARYDLAGLQGRDNQAAAGGADNGGNIDSYSAANALRQQAALRSLGEQTALEAHSRTVSDGRGILSDRTNYLQGIYNQMTGAIDSEIKQNNADTQRWIELLNTGMSQNQRLFDNEQTALNNSVNRDVLTSQVTGNVPAAMLMKEYGLADEYGNLINVNIDYHAKINELYAERGKTSDPEKIRNIDNQIAAYTAARNVKIGMSEYQKYANDMTGSYYAPVAGAATNQSNAQLAQKKYETDINAELTRQGYDVEKYKIDANKDTALKGYEVEKYKIDTNKEISLKEINANIDYNKANLEWQKEYGKLEMNYKNKALSQEAANFAMSIEKDIYIAKLNSDAAKDANAVQRELIASNERIAQIEKQAKNYATDKNAQIALSELKLKEEQFNAELKQRAAEFDSLNLTRQVPDGVLSAWGE